MWTIHQNSIDMPPKKGKKVHHKKEIVLQTITMFLATRCLSNNLMTTANGRMGPGQSADPILDELHRITGRKCSFILGSAAEVERFWSRARNYLGLKRTNLDVPPDVPPHLVEVGGYGIRM